MREFFFPDFKRARIRGLSQRIHPTLNPPIVDVFERFRKLTSYGPSLTYYLLSLHYARCPSGGVSSYIFQSYLDCSVNVCTKATALDFKT